MGEYNLTSTMKRPEPVAAAPIVHERVVSFSFPFPEAVLKKTSDLNTKWQDTYSKRLTGRLLAGSVKKLLSKLNTMNEVFSGPLPGKKYAQQSLQQNVRVFQELLHELIADLDARLIIAYKYDETKFPSGSEPVVRAMIKAGFFEGLEPNEKLCTLPNRIKLDLGMASKLKPIYSKQKLGQQSSLEESLKTLELLYPFIAEMKEYKIETEFIEVAEDE